MIQTGFMMGGGEGGSQLIGQMARKKGPNILIQWLFFDRMEYDERIDLSRTFSCVNSLTMYDIPKKQSVISRSILYQSKE